MGIFDKYLIDEEEEKKESIFDKYFIKPQVGLGVGAKATGGISLPETPEIKPLIEGLPISKPEDKPAGLFEDPQMIESHKANFEYWKLWLKELKESKDKLAFLKGEGKSPELIETQKKSDELLPYMYGEKGGKWLNAIAMSLYSMGLISEIIPLLSQLPANILNNLAYKVEGKTVKGKELFDVLRRIQLPNVFGEPSTFDRKVFDQFVFENMKSVSQRMAEGIKVTTTVPRFAFGAGKLSAMPIPDLVKAIVEYGSIPPDIAKEIAFLDPVKVSQVAQQLLNTSPALASAFLKAVEKPEMAKVKEEVTPAKVEAAPAIPAELEGLVEEARKYESAEEFEKAVSDVMAKKNQFGGLSNKAFRAKLTKDEISLSNAHLEGKLGLHQLSDFYAQATAGTKAEGKVEAIVKPAEAVTEKPAIVEAPAPIKPEVELATPAQINKAYSIAKSRAMVSEEGKLKPQYRKIAEVYTGKKYIEKMTPEEVEIFIDQLNRLPEPKYRNGKLVPPSIPRTMKLTTEGFFQKKYGEPTPIWLLTDQTYYAEKLGIKSLVEPFEKGKQEFDLEFRKSSNLVDRMVNKLNQVAKTPGFEIIKSKFKNIPTKAESKMAGLLNKHETTPSGLSPKEEDVFKYFRNLSKDIWRRENEVREKLDLPPIKYKTAYFRHTADAMAKEMLEGKYPFPQGIKYWSEKMVGKKIFNPMEFHRKLSDDLIDLWSKDIRAVTKAMLWNGLKEIHLAQPAKFLNEQLNAISKDLPEYKNLTPAEQAAYEQTQVMPASTKKWLIDYINQVIKGQETELDASLNRIVTKSGLKGIFDKALSPFGRSVGRTPITHLFSLSGRMIISGTMGWVPRQIIRNAFQQVQNLALYGVQATIKSFLPASIDKNLKGLLSESLFMKSYTGFEELPTDLMGKLEKIWLQPYGIVAVNNAKQGMKASYWNILELIKNPKFKKYGWADPQRTKDTPKGFLYPSEEEKLLKEMEFGSSCTQYQYIPMGMPGVFRYKALIPLTRLQSWWMNYFAKFTREAIHRGLKGRPSWSGEDGPTLPWSRRVNWLKYLVIGGAILTAMGYRRSFLIGVLPTYLSPAGQVALGLYNYATATEDWQKKRALNQIYYSWKAFIPGSLAWRDFLAVWNGEKELEEILFYGKKEKEKIVKPTSPYLDKYKKETTVTPTSTYLNKYKK